VNFPAGDFICLPTQQSASLCYLSSSTGRLVFGPRWTVTYTSKKCFMFPTRQEDNGVATKKKVEIPTRRLGEDVPKPSSHPPVERNVSPVVSRLQSHCAERRHVPRLLRCWTSMDVRTLAHGMHHNDRAISDIGASMSGSINIKAELTNRLVPTKRGGLSPFTAAA